MAVGLSAEFADARLVAVYDALNAYRPGTQPDFYVGLAAEVGAGTVIEIGCGTGLITTDFARAGFDVIGIEPSQRMLEVARRRRATERVRWVLGGVSELAAFRADMAFMAGHVAQFFVTDEAWDEAVTATHAALRPGGVFAFESRNPAAQAWTSWTPSQTRRAVVDPAIGRIETWTAEVEASGGVVTCVQHYRFAASGDALVARTALRFRSRGELERSLDAGGFAVERLYGNWDRRPFSDRDEEIIVVARRV